MQELIVNLLLAVAAVLAAVLRVMGQKPSSGMTRKQKTMLWRILAASVLLLALQLLGAPAFAQLGAAGRWVRLACYAADYLIIGYDILRKAGRGIRNGQIFDENFLMALATLGALALAVYENGDYLEAIAVMLFYQVGEWFQSYAVGRSRRNISDLMDIRPDYANIEQDGKLEQVDPDEVAIGTVIVVQPGEKVPIDGTVVVISGCINMTGLLKIRTTKEFGESTVSKILDLVENASSRKSHSEAFISRFAKIYTPAVCIAAVALAILPSLVTLALGQPPAWETWLYRALTFLVASCPCALVISIPLSFFAGIGGASKAGVLVKGSNYLETLSKTKIMVFDKTGTLTQGVFEVNGIHHSEMENARLVEYAALAESSSTHPISKSLLRAYGKPVDRTRVTDVQEISGNGVTATVDGCRVAAGNGKLMERLGLPYIACHSVGTIIHVAIDGKYMGHIVISDRVKPHAAEAIRALRAAGIRKTVMLTGDARRVAEQVAGELGVDEVYSELLPAGKVEKMEALLSEKPENARLAFVGDGINDAPVLRRADIGIAMGAMGSDAAIEAADVVLMDDDPLKIAKAIRISRKCLRIVYQNIAAAIGIKLICLVLVALGMANMWLAVFADVGVMILAVLNAIRALFVKKL